MKTLNDNNKVDDVYLSPFDRWLLAVGNFGSRNENKARKKVNGKE